MTHGRIPLGRIAGISIYAHWSALATLVLFTWLLGASVLPSQLTGESHLMTWTVAACAALGLLTSLLAHELAHSIVARRHGVRVDRITLWLLGGISELTEEPKDPRTDLRVAVAGPLTSAATGVGFFAIALLLGTIPSKTVETALVWLAVTNIVLAVFNLLPAAPLDGGRVVRAAIWARTGDRLRGEAAAARAGRGLGTGLIALGVLELLLWRNGGGLWLMLLGWYLRSAAAAELADASARHQLGDLRVGQVMTPSPLTVPAELPVSSFLGTDGMHLRHRVFPVVDASNRPVGELSLRELARLPQSVRDTVPAGRLARPLAAAAVVGEHTLLTTVLTGVVLRPGLDLIAVVGDDGQLVGVITARDLANVCDRSALGLPTTRAAG